MIETEILVLGAGPAGMCAAIETAARGYRVVLAGPTSRPDDRRTTALMAPAVAFLDGHGIWGAIGPESAPLATMRIVDDTKRLVRAPAATFHAAEIGEEAFGWNVPNTVLNGSLELAVGAVPSIRRLTTAARAVLPGADSVEVVLDDNQRVTAKLVVAADGRNSIARAASGIAVREWKYPQTAVVLTFAHERPHNDVSTEFHTESGPFTQVPLPGRRSSLVWVASPARAAELMALDRKTLAKEVERGLHSMLGKVTIETGPQSWLLAGLQATAFAARRIALAGEAAHVFPPIGAQGLNLGLRDVRDLGETLGSRPDDPGAPAVLAAYDRRRRPDIAARTAAVDLLNRSLLSPLLPAQVARAMGLSALAAISPLRSFFMREGMAPGWGFREALRPAREQVGRKNPLRHHVEERGYRQD